jgi:hypothetical protein
MNQFGLHVQLPGGRWNDRLYFSAMIASAFFRHSWLPGASPWNSSVPYRAATIPSSPGFWKMLETSDASELKARREATLSLRAPGQAMEP